MITAWQISSTMDKMEEFIRFIEQFDTQREKLERLLPVIPRIKRISEEKESINKELLELEQTHIIIAQGNSSLLVENTNASLDKKLAVTSISQDISRQQDEHTKEIRKLIKEVDNNQIKEEKELLLRREELLKELDHEVIRSSQLKVIDAVINNEEYEEEQKRQLLLSSSPQVLGSTSPNDNNINSNIYTKHIDEQINSLSLINHNILNNDDNHSTYNIAQPIYTKQLYELKCKLASLSDRRRKLAVNRLFHSNVNNNNNNININNTNIMNKYQYQQKVQESHQKYEVVEQEYEEEDRERSEQNYNNNSKGFLNSIMAMFSSSSTTTNSSNQNNTTHKKDKEYNERNKSQSKQEPKSIEEKQSLENQFTNPTKQSPNKQTNQIKPHHLIHYHPLPSLHDIDDIEVRLKLSEIIAEIYEFREDINVMVEQNLLMRLNRMVSNLEIVNREINCYEEELIKVGRVVKEQMLLGNNKGNNNNNFSYSKNKNNRLNLLKQNPQLQFFTEFINKNILHRHKILHSIFTSILPSIPPIIKHITNRLTELERNSEEFEQTNRSKYSMKLKATKSKKEFEILTKEMEGIKGYLEEIVLVRIRQVESLLIEGLRMYVEGLKDCEMMVGYNMVEQQQYQQQQQYEIQQLLELLLKTNNQHLIATVEEELTINSLLLKICAEEEENTENNNSNEEKQFYYYRMQLFYEKLSTTYQCLGSIIIAV